MQTLQYLIEPRGMFPNSPLPVVHYKQAVELPLLLPSLHIKNLFSKNGWTNNWTDGIYAYHHYHTITHEALGICKGSTQLLLGGNGGTEITIVEGDVLVIPAGVAHRNLGNMHDVSCVGGYPNGMDFDMNYGTWEEMERTLHNIASLPIPGTDPLLGLEKGIVEIWKAYAKNNGNN
jgi:uncharacterized protein YjlB